MPKLPRLTAREICAILERHGFFIARQSGSHIIYKNVGGKRVPVLFHAAKIVHPKILRNILRDAELSVEDLLCTRRSADGRILSALSRNGEDYEACEEKWLNGPYSLD